MKLKNFKSSTALIGLALSLTLTGYNTDNQNNETKISIETEDNFNEIEFSSDLEVEKENQKLSKKNRNIKLKNSNNSKKETITAADILGDMVNIKKVTISREKTNNRYYIEFTSDKDIYYSVLENDIEALKNLLFVLPYTKCKSLTLQSCDDLEILNSISNKEQFTTLTIIDSDSKEMNGLESFSNLEELNVLFCSNLSDIKAIGQLEKLKKLQIRGTHISDITALSNLSNLENADLINNEISDITSLKKLESLNSVSLFYNNFTNTNQLQFLVEKKIITENELNNILNASLKSDKMLVSENAKENSKNKCLAIYELDKNQYFLEVTSNDGEVLSFTQIEKEKLTEPLIFFEDTYQEISLYFCKDSNILNRLLHPEEISELHCQNCDFNELKNMDYFSNLKTLRISNCENFSDISSLESLKNLESVSIFNSQITNLESLANLQKISNLSLVENKINDISPLIELPNLKYLNVDYNYISTDSSILSEFLDKGIVICINHQKEKETVKQLLPNN